MIDLIPNGFVLQRTDAPSYTVLHNIKAFSYHGLDAYSIQPLDRLDNILHDREAYSLCQEACSLKVAENTYVLREFFCDPDLLTRYIHACQKRAVPIRALFVESDYARERWHGPRPNGELWGFSYNTIPFDDQIVTDLYWYAPLFRFWPMLNAHGLFTTQADVLAFKTAYDRAFDAGEIGDGEMETHIFRLTEVGLEEALTVASAQLHGV